MHYRIVTMVKARQMKGWTQAHLARVIGKDPSTISKIESGLIEGNPPTMKLIADVLGLSMEDILVEEEARAS